MPQETEGPRDECAYIKAFERNKTTDLSVDASKNDLGAVIMQDSKPVAYASASLSTSRGANRR